MPVKVADASAIVAYLFGEPAGDTIWPRLEDATLVAPQLLPFEVANACLKKLRTQPPHRESLLAAFAELAELDIELREVEQSAVLSTAENTGLSLYDASYLWLARELDAELVTLDKRLGEAFRSPMPRGA
jgi:predicted nucleic acid-binding protein